jgi:ethanolamine ammonia-lyase small subunit
MDRELIEVDCKNIIERDCWGELKSFTDARIALGRTGYSMPTDEYLKFSLAHARARDTIHTPFDRDKVKGKLENMGLDTICVESSAPDRSVFLTRPDLGRRLSDKSREKLKKMDYPGADVLLVIGDGLSSKAVHKQAVPLIQHLLPYLGELNLSVGPVVLAEQSRVALADDIAEQMHCKLVASLIGERPGLSSPDSLGVYMTYKPYWGRLESERNCISNIRPAGLSYQKAAFKLAWLIEAAFDMKKSGTALKDQSDDPSCYRLLKPHRDDYFIAD